MRNTAKLGLAAIHLSAFINIYKKYIIVIIIITGSHFEMFHQICVQTSELFIRTCNRVTTYSVDDVC